MQYLRVHRGNLALITRALFAVVLMVFTACSFSTISAAAAPASDPPCAIRASFPDTTTDSFVQETLAAINADRAKNGSPPVVVSAVANAYAKVRAQQESRCAALSLGHAGLSGYGENLFWSGNPTPVYEAGANAVNSWYSEMSSYNFNNPGFSSSTGHFTQLVWKSSTAVGIARVSGQGSSYYENYIVVDFSPPGNVAGAFTQNVRPPTQ